MWLLIRVGYCSMLVWGALSSLCWEERGSFPPLTSCSACWRLKVSWIKNQLCCSNVCPRRRVARPLGCSDVQVIEELKSCGVENKFKTRVNWLCACALCHCTTQQRFPRAVGLPALWGKHYFLENFSGRTISCKLSVIIANITVR